MQHSGVRNVNWLASVRGRSLLTGIVVAFALALSSLLGEAYAGEKESTTEMVTKRTFGAMLDGQWIGNGISYSPYRDGESPADNSLTSKEHILEDLKLIEKRWRLIRLYGADLQAQRVLEVIRDEKLGIKVMQGAWVSGHQSREENLEQIQGVIRLANAFPDIVVAANVGNEIFVDWSWHKVTDYQEVIDYIRLVRSQIKQPVTVNDDYNFWNKPHARQIVNEIDFIGLHAYAFWNNKNLDEALSWTQSIYKDIRQRYPEHMVAICETGWPTSRVYDDSYEGQLIGKAGEAEQDAFFDAYDAWVSEEKIVSLYFSSFDERWKGGFDGENPRDKAEKHWGLYRSDRSPKYALMPTRSVDQDQSR